MARIAAVGQPISTEGDFVNFVGAIDGLAEAELLILIAINSNFEVVAPRDQEFPIVAHSDASQIITGVIDGLEESVLLPIVPKNLQRNQDGLLRVR